MKSNEIVVYYSITPIGRQDEWKAGNSGFAHPFEHTMFRGIGKYSDLLYSKIITVPGADANAYTTNDYAIFRLKDVPANNEQSFNYPLDIKAKNIKIFMCNSKTSLSRKRDRKL